MMRTLWDSLQVLVLLTLTAGTAAQTSSASCQAKATAAPPQTNLTNVKTAYTSVPNSPFQIVYASKQKDIAFVTLAHTFANSTLGVLNTSTFAPTLIHQVALPESYINHEGANGLALSHDGRYIFIAAGQGAVVLDAARAAAGKPNAVVGTLNGTTASQNPGNASIQITVTKNNSYAFVSQEYGPSGGRLPGNVDVFKLITHHNGNISGVALGSLNLGFEVVATVLSPDDRILYATSEGSDYRSTTTGFISVIDVETLVANPSNSNAILSNVTAACGPVRALVSSDGTIVWVSARESDEILAFNATKMITNPANALIASVQVGTAPIDLAFVRNGSQILTADSNRFNSTGATSGVSVVDVKAALKGSASAVLGRVPTGLFAREIALSPDGERVLISDYESGQIQAIDVASLPQ